MMKEFWDQRYSTKDYVYGKEPNARFRRFIQGFSPGKLLLPGEGEGRNAVFAASLGWDVYAIDQSAEGRCKALALAEEKGVIINYTIADLSSFHLPKDEYDAVSLVFLHLPPVVRKHVHKKLVRSLRKGGMMHMLAFTPEQLNFKTGGPGDISMLYTREMALDDFAELNDVHIVDVKEEFSEGPHHHGPYRAIELTGIR